ncbi:MAG: hypothetical protein M1816_002164 [Peltula sp. TS41687]|nr:MAG: hypothetical protein M1816_002164 [Peltula sp. TS41687]
MLEQLLLHTSTWKLAIVATAIYAIWSLVRWNKRERRIQALGGHAAVVKTYLPFGIDFVYRAITTSFRHESLEMWQDLYASARSHTVEVSLGGERMVVTEDPENIKAILATQFQDFGKGEQFHRDWHEFLGDSIFTTDGEQWHESRQLIRPQFIKDRVSDLNTFERHVAKLLDRMGGQGQSVDVKALFFRYTLDAATDFLLGKSVDSLENPQVEFAESFPEVQRIQNLWGMAGNLHRIFPRGTFRRHLKVINEFVNPYIERALLLSPEELEKRTKSDSGYTFLHALAGFTRDRKVLRDQIVAVLLASRDTTASTLSWTFYELARHPALYHKLRHEILHHVGPSQAPTYTDLKSLKYLQHVMNETLRLYPSVPYNIRCASVDTSLPHGGGPDGLSPVGIPKDTPTAYCTLNMQRRPELYPPSPAFPDILEFCPERWDVWTPKSWTYIPFNGGPRICVGQQFALTEMAYTIVRICQRFERIERRWPDGAGISLKAEIVLQPAEEVTVAFWRAEK